MRDGLVLGLFAIGLLGFFLMAYAFGRLFRQAWKSDDRKAMMRKVLHLQPRKDAEWPNMTPEADLVAIGALCGVVFCGGLLLIAFWR
jgi:hypothetical protein